MEFDSIQLDSLSGLLHKSLFVLLNFVDDIALCALTRLGVHWLWLHWLSTALVIVTIVYWSIRLWRYCDRRLGKYQR
ncbi:MAG: hypothetical protein AAF282_08155 [Cyanobacteria bacterium P01_A01_bin.15]